MTSPRVILDSDFLSAFLKIGRLDLIRELFAVDALLVPPAVYREVSATHLLSDLAAASWVRIEAPDINRTRILGHHEDFPKLGPGEQEAITLAAEREGSILLMNDNEARRIATQVGVKTINVPAFLLACKESGLRTRAEIAELVVALEERDRYGFRKDVRELLLS